MALNRGDRVLLDTNVILEAHRVGCWRAIASEFSLISVEKVIEETQTGHQNRSREQQIDEQALRESMEQVATVSLEQIAATDIQYPNHGLDAGEHHLVSFAATIDENQVWLLNSPDKGTIRFCSGANWLERLISLQAMIEILGLPHGSCLRGNYTRSWLEREIARFRFGLY